MAMIPLGLADRSQGLYAEGQQMSLAEQGFKEQMSKERLANLLHQLQTELSNTEDLNAELSEQLRLTAAELRQLLDAEDAAGVNDEASQGIIAQLRQAATRFEDSHPALTSTVGRIADALAQLGI